MSRHKSFILIFILVIENGLCKENNDEILQKNDQCNQICNDNFFLLPIVSDTKDICERGCRLFNLIDAKESADTNKSKAACHASCNEAYVASNFDACIIGCNEMEKKRVLDLSSNAFFVYVEREGSDNIMVVQPELEQIDLDILADPGFRKQLEYQLEYKIPETHIRTMPINSNLDEFGVPSDIQMKQLQSSGDWLDCASRNSGIPRFILISAILMAVLIAAWLITASDKREPVAPPDLLDDENVYPSVHDPPPVYTEKCEKFNLETEKV